MKIILLPAPRRHETEQTFFNHTPTPKIPPIPSNTSAPEFQTPPSRNAKPEM
jgi:hypothetical protein